MTLDFKNMTDKEFDELLKQAINSEEGKKMLIDHDLLLEESLKNVEK